MLTIFALPKSFNGHFCAIQRNAISQWSRLRPRPEIILFGDEEGTGEIAQEFGLRHVPEVKRNEYGTPLLNDVFEKAQALASSETLCYVNSDIILLGDFMKAVQQVISWRERFLMVGRRKDVNLDQPAIYESPEQEDRLRALVLRRGRVSFASAIDYFVFPRGLFTLPEFAVGRPYWDNWMIWRARVLRVPVVDASAVILAVHQNHDYSHHPGGQRILNEESRQNRRLAARRVFTIDDATHKLRADGIKARPFLSIIPKAVRACWWRFLMITGPIRRPLGLRREKVASVLGRVGETLCNSSDRLLANTAFKPIKKNGESIRS